jgi:uncharacterized protein (TIGR03492 family)
MISIRVISNGHGEDLIAARIISSLGLGAYEFHAFPLVGPGHAFLDLGIPPKIRQASMPSGGFLLRFKDIVSDLKSGLLMQFQKQRGSLNAAKADYQIVVGDVFALFMASSKHKMPTIFFPTAKSERAIPHYKLELMYIRKHADIVFPRDIETHERFIQQGIPSQFFGNPMFDGMVSNAAKAAGITVALLPGSRKEALKNMSLMLSIISKLRLNRLYSFVFSISPHIRYSELKLVINDLPWVLEKDDVGYLFKFSQAEIRVRVSYAFFDVLQLASVVLGLAGTANEQAMHANRYLISFIGAGPQSTKQRFQQQHQLIAGALTHFIDSNQPDVIAKELSDALNANEFEWTPLSDHHQQASKFIADYLRLNLIRAPVLE